jgi:NAD(P)-dependent dehydrogenase (short-subunit alcohol dehydrogenase family)
LLRKVRRSSSGAARGRARELVAEIEAAGGTAIAAAGDVRSETYARSLVETAAGRYGRLDVAFNNAGTMGEAGPTTEVSEAGWTDTLATI